MTPVRFLVVPQWQGSGSPRRLQIGAGAAAIAAVRARFPLGGAGITEFTPWSDGEAAGDLVTIRRILDALTG